MNITHSTAKAAEDAAVNGVATVATEERWMVASWCIRDGRVVLAQRDTWKFPRADFLEALSQLAHSCFQDQLSADRLPNDPLPFGPLLGRRFARPVEEDKQLPTAVPLDNDEDGEPDSPDRKGVVFGVEDDIVDGKEPGDEIA